MFYLILLIFSIIGLPLTAYLFPKLTDKGYPFAKILSLLVISYIAWILSSLFKTPVNFYTLVVITIIVAAISFKLGYKNLKEVNLKLILFEEILFIVFFVAMLAFRGSIPKIEGIEKFMDYAIVNGIHRGQTVPPQDVWFSGFNINYYYFGHFSINTLLTLSNENPAIAYNFAVATIMSLVASAAFSINLELTKNKFYSVIGSLLLVAGGNLDYLYNVIFLHTPNYFYAQARSLIPNTINEFPAYSFLIGDLHAHILDIPYVLLFLILVIYKFLHSDEKSKLYIVIGIISMGALGVTNSWDYFIYIPLILGLFLLSNQIISAGIIVVGAFIAYLPFYLNFNPPSGGVGFTHPYNELGPILTMFGFLIFFAILNFKKPKDIQSKLVLLLSIFGILLIFAPEFVFVKDIYFKLNPPYYRANTIFKVWYQSWIILTLCAPFCFYNFLKTVKNIPIKVSVGIVAAVLSFFVFAYAVISVRYIVGPKYIFQGLDGSAYLAQQNPDEKQVIDYINKNIAGQPVLLEAVGNSYTMQSAVSSYTGLPTIVGWNEHELGWRDNWDLIAARMGDVEKMYKSNSVIEVSTLVRIYKVKYAVIGNDEYLSYGNSAGTTLKSMSTMIAKFNNSELLKINPIQ